MRGSGMRLLLMLTLLVGMALTVNGFNLFDVVENGFTFIETKISMSDDAVNMINVDGEVAVICGQFEQEAVMVNTLLVDTGLEVDLLIGSHYCVPALNANGFDLWEESLLIADYSKPEGLLRIIGLI